jgi:hypothetical protein
MSCGCEGTRTNRVCDGFRACLVVFRVVAGVVAGVVDGGHEVYQYHSARVVTGGVLNPCGPLLPSRRGKNPASPWRVSLESTNLTHASVYGFLPRADEELTFSMHGAPRKTHEGDACETWVTLGPH